MIWIDTLLVIDTLISPTKKWTLLSRLSLSESTINVSIENRSRYDHFDDWSQEFLYLIHADIDFANCDREL
jgi:hypothetical protein